MFLQPIEDRSHYQLLHGKEYQSRYWPPRGLPVRHERLTITLKKGKKLLQVSSAKNHFNLVHISRGEIIFPSISTRQFCLKLISSRQEASPFLGVGSVF